MNWRVVGTETHPNTHTIGREGNVKFQTLEEHRGRAGTGLSSSAHTNGRNCSGVGMGTINGLLMSNGVQVKSVQRKTAVEMRERIKMPPIYERQSYYFFLPFRFLEKSF